MTDANYLQEIPGSTKYGDPDMQRAYEKGLREGKILAAQEADRMPDPTFIDHTMATKCARQITELPNTALFISPSCPQCGGLKHAYWFGHPEMQHLARGYLEFQRRFVTGKLVEIAQVEKEIIGLDS